MVDHGQLGAVVGPDMPGLTGRRPGRCYCIDEIGGPNLERSLPVGVVSPCVGRRCSNGSWGSNSSTKRKNRSCRLRRPDPRSGRHRPWPGGVRFVAEVRPRVVVVHVRGAGFSRESRSSIHVGSGRVRHGSFSWPRS